VPTALVTGASSGIGLELARLIARDRYDLVLVARQREKLEALGQSLATQHGVRVSVLAKDLADPAAPAAIGRELDERRMAVDVLVNNAGFGVYGFFADTPLDRELEMIQVNVSALTALTKIFLPQMRERKSGRILNVASTASFQPGPIMAVYYATKAYVLSFSEALASETAGTGVTVTTLCPGPTRTEFETRAGSPRRLRLLKSGLIQGPAEVARAGWEATKRGKRLVIPGLANRLFVQAERVTPRRVVTAISRRLREPRG
jgi:uncharacterized protein